MTVYALYGVAADGIGRDCGRARRIIPRLYLRREPSCHADTVRDCLGQHDRTAVILPIELQWLGAHFRIDALVAFFLAAVNFGDAAASLFQIALPL